jgi:hypothetical protein
VGANRFVACFVICRDVGRLAVPPVEGAVFFALDIQLQLTLVSIQRRKR